MSRGARRAIVAVAAFCALPFGGAWVWFRAPEARVDALEAALARDLERESARRFERRPVLRGTPREGEVLAAISSALASVPYPGGGDQQRLLRERLFSPTTRRERDALVFPAELEDLHPDAARTVGALREAVARERFEARWEVGRDWQKPDELDAWPSMIEPVFGFEALRALERDPAEAARIVADFWRLRHDVVRDRPLIAHVALSRWGDPFGFVVILALAIERLDARGLDEMERELAILEATLPSFGRAARRQRLAVGCWFREARRGAPGRDPSLPSWAPVRDRPDLRDPRILLREWEGADALHRSAEETFDALGPDEARRTLALPAVPLEKLYEVSRLLSRPQITYVCRLRELAYLRVARALVAARRFELARGRFPRSHEEALGRAPAAGETDPFGGGPLRFREGAGGRSLVVSSIGMNMKDDGRIAPVFIDSGNTWFEDDGVELRRRP